MTEFDKMMANSMNQYNQLMGIAGLGMGATTTLNNENTNYANNMGNLAMYDAAADNQNSTSNMNNLLGSVGTGLKTYAFGQNQGWWGQPQQNYGNGGLNTDYFGGSINGGESGLNADMWA